MFIDKKNKKVIICLVDEDTGTQPPHSESLSNTSLDTMPSYNGTVSRKKRNEDRDNYKTVGEALEGISDDLPNQGDITISKPETLERMKHVSQGGNWRDIPKYLLPKRFGENTHSSIYKRLDLNKPSIAITNVRKSNILHPLHDRILSIREAARLFDLKDDFIFKGTLSSKQQQIANGITANLAKAIGTQIKEAFKRFQYTNMVRNNVWVH